MDISSIQRLWPDVVEAVKQRSRAAWMVIVSGVQPVALDGKVLTLGFDAEGHRLGFVNGGRDAVVREILKERTGVDWRIDTVVDGGGGSRPDTGRPSGGPSSGFGSSQPATGFGTGSPSQPAQPSPPPPPAPRDSDERPAPQPESARTPPPSPPPVDESDEVDPEGDADADGTEAETSGMALLERELGGQIIKEIDSSAAQA